MEHTTSQTTSPLISAGTACPIWGRIFKVLNEFNSHLRTRIDIGNPQFQGTEMEVSITNAALFFKASLSLGIEIAKEALPFTLLDLDREVGNEGLHSKWNHAHL